MGFTEGIKAYKLYDHVTHHVVYFRSVTFDEQKLLRFPSVVERPPEPGEGEQMITESESQYQYQPSLDDDEVDDLTDIAVTHKNISTERDEGHENLELEPELAEPEDNDPESKFVRPTNIVASEGPQPVSPLPRTLRSRANIRPPVACSPSSWASSRARTDWDTQHPVIDETT